MAKQGGMGANFYVGGYDLSTQTYALANVHGGSAAQQDVTDITQSGMARLALLRDGGIDWTSFFDPTSNAHTLLSALPTADEICQLHLPTSAGAQAIGNPVAALTAKVIGYDPTVGADKSLTLGVQAQANGFGLEWGVALTPGHRVDSAATAAGAGNSYDTGGSLAFGAQMYVQLFAFSGTSVTIKVQDSADNITFNDISGTSLTTSALTTGVQAVRVAIPNTTTVRRYIAVGTVGTFSNADFAVMVNKNNVAGVVF